MQSSFKHSKECTWSIAKDKITELGQGTWPDTVDKRETSAIRAIEILIKFPWFLDHTSKPYKDESKNKDNTMHFR